MKLLSLIGLALFLSRAQSAIPVWGQCGGSGYEGRGVAGTTCYAANDFYSECRPVAETTALVVRAATGLDGLLKARGKKFWGVCAEPSNVGDAALITLIKREFGLIASLSTQWAQLEPSRWSFNFAASDSMLNWSIANGKMFRGRAVVWHSQLPSWVSSISDGVTLTTVIQNHVTAVWNLVNEAFNEDGTLHSSVFSNVLGENYITIAFSAARAADPIAKLFINDYNLDSVNSKLKAMVNLVKKINASGKIIDGIGTAAHLQSGGAGDLQAALTALAGTGVDVAITELDITGAASADYVAVVRACLAVAGCESITSYQAVDGSPWGGPIGSGALFDSSGKPKPAYDAVVEFLSTVST